MAVAICQEALQDFDGFSFPGDPGHTPYIHTQETLMAKLTQGEAIGKRLRDWSLSKYATLGEAAEALKINQVHLSAYMAGRNIPGNKLQAKLRALGCNIDWLMTGETPDTEAALRGLTIYPTYAVQTVPPASQGETIDKVREGITLEYPARSHVWLTVTEDNSAGMQPIILYGEHCLISLKGEAKSGDLVAARWGSKSAIRFADIDNGSVVLKALNPNLPAVVLPREKVAMFRIILIKKH